MNTQRGPVVAIMHQYAYTGKGKTIHSCAQLESYGNDVNDKSVKVPGGLQRIVTVNGYNIPLVFKDALPYIHIRPFTDAEWDTVPHVVLTSDADWDPSILDHSLIDHEDDSCGNASMNGEPNHADEWGAVMPEFINDQAQV